MVEIYEQDEISIDSTDVKYVVKNGRGSKTEFYPAIPDDDEKLAVTACGLANSGGGQIIIGISKDGSKIGLESPTEVESTAAEILKKYIDRTLDLKFVTASVEIDGHDLLFISISEYRDFPLTSDGRFYRRHQKEDILLPPDEVSRLIGRASGK